MWCWGRVENITWVNCVRSEEVLQEGMERAIYYRKQEGELDLPHLAYEPRSKARYWWRQIRDEKMRWRRKQLLDDLKETIRFWKSKEEPLARTVSRSRFGGGYGIAARQTAWWRWWVHRSSGLYEGKVGPSHPHYPWKLTIEETPWYRQHTKKHHSMLKQNSYKRKYSV
jgi:hypothetical protein